MRLTWKREPRETGLRAIGSAPRGSKLHDGEKTYATVSANGGGWARKQNGWYWVAGWDSDVPYMNTCNTPCATEADAKREATEYVKSSLKSLEQSK